MGAFTIFHFIIAIIVFLGFVAVSVLIYFKVKNLQTSIACYVINTLVGIILMYSLFLTIDQYTTQAKISELSFNRNLRSESLTISGKITNLTSFAINKCYLELSIMNKTGTPDGVFNPQNFKRSTNAPSNSVRYVLEIVSNLPGSTYKTFSVQIPYPPSFTSADFYHTLNCI